MVSCGVPRDTKSTLLVRLFFPVSILDWFNSKEWLARLHCWVFCFNLQVRDPTATHLDKLRHAAHVGMEVGDVLQATAEPRRVRFPFLLLREEVATAAEGDGGFQSADEGVITSGSPAPGVVDLPPMRLEFSRKE